MNEMGLKNWLEMTEEQQALYLRNAERERLAMLKKLTYEEALLKTHDLFGFMDIFPVPPRQDLPKALSEDLPGAC